MNDRIRELEKQATEIVRCGLNGTSTAEVFDRKKFAELIVQECIKSAQPICEYPIDGTWIEKSYWEGCSDAAEQIKEHFGVE